FFLGAANRIGSVTSLGFGERTAASIHFSGGEMVEHHGARLPVLVGTLRLAALVLLLRAMLLLATGLVDARSRLRRARRLRSGFSNARHGSWRCRRHNGLFIFRA